VILIAKQPKNILTVGGSNALLTDSDQLSTAFTVT